MECPPNEAQAFSDFYGYQFYPDQSPDLRMYRGMEENLVLPRTSSSTQDFHWDSSVRPYPHLPLQPSRASPPRKRPTAAPRRINVNQKERRRNLAINDAFFDLQRLIPHVPREHSLPKIKTLRLAVNYISSLQNLLHNDQPSLPEMKTDFARVVASEIQARNSYKDRADQLLRQSREGSSSPDKVDEGMAGVEGQPSGFHQTSRHRAA